MDHGHKMGTCGFCLVEKPSYRYRTVAVEVPTPDGGTVHGNEADWNVCAACSELVEARRWAELADRVYRARAEAVPSELHASVRRAAQQAVELFGSAVLGPRRPVLDLWDHQVPVPTREEVAAFDASLSSDEEDEEGPELADWDWIAEEIVRAKAAGGLEADWVVESDLSFLGEFSFAMAKYRLDGEEGEAWAHSFHEYDGHWEFAFDLRQPEGETLELGPREVLAVLRRAEEVLRAAGAEFVRLPEDGNGRAAD